MTTGSVGRHFNGLEIAVIGMAGRFPGAQSIEMFWHNVREGIESVSILPDEALLAAGVDPAALKDSRYVRARAVLEDIDLFDAAFFGFTPREAELLDPQHRLFLETAWQALEQAGYDVDRYARPIGVYGGASLSGYLFRLMPDRYLLQSASDMAAMLAADKDFLATRVSYKLNLEGPSLTVQSACSTSLVAVHLACQGLLSGECDMALAGGVSVSVPQHVGYLYQEGGIASPDGHCRTFDAQAQGTVAGSGVGIVVLKRLADALADGDRVVAIIKGSAVNNDGAKKVGYTAPGVEGQVKVIMAAHAMAEVRADTIGYVEAHGTATPMGDPIEIAALTQAFGGGSAGRRSCAIGSVKTNIGHLDAAAGIAGLIKTLLALEHKIIPPSLHFSRPNPHIDFDAGPFYVNTAALAWPAGPTPRRAGVSSFGIGGTNAHVVLEEAPTRDPVSPSRPWHVMIWSAKTPSSLEAMTAQLARYFHEPSDQDAADEAFTLQLGRKAFPYRRMVLCRTRSEAAALMGNAAQDAFRAGGPIMNDRAVAFMFSGQGAQVVNMGRELYEHERMFREQVDHCASLLHEELPLDLRTLLYPAEERADWAQQQLNQTMFTQPALFVVEYALAKLWMAWGVRPHAMIGHSIGEYVAACLAGVFSLADALALVALRGRLMQQQPAGAMLAVPLSELHVRPYLSASVSLAAVNAPSQCVLSGPLENIAEVQRSLAARGIEGRSLQTSHAFHSAMMDPILTAFEERVRAIPRRPPDVPYISTVTGTWISGADVEDPRYWARQLRDTVRFADGVRVLAEGSDQIFLEVGPGHTLARLATQCAEQGDPPLSYPSLYRPRSGRLGGSELAGLLETLGNLWVAGVPVDWAGFHAGERRRRVPLPTYPFERRRYWYDDLSKAEARENNGRAAAGRAGIEDWFYVPSWKRSVVPRTPSPRPTGRSSWLLFVNGGPIREGLVRILEASGRSVTTVSIGPRFQRLGNGTYSMRPAHRDDYVALREALELDRRRPDVIIHAWSLSEDTRRPMELFDEAQERGFYSLLFVAQVFSASRVTLLALSNGLHDITGQEVLRPHQATMLGACRVIPQEYPNIVCRNVDLDVGSMAPDDGTVWVDQLLQEADILEPQSTVAYRARHRWVQEFDSAALAACTPQELPPLLRRQGVYLVTGGLGGVGLQLADYLARTVQARLVVTGRSEPTPEQRRCMTRVQELGAELLVMQADAADISQMRHVLDRARAHFGEIHGVVHAAGIPGGGMIEMARIDALQRELAPKAKGALVLDELFVGRQPDFMLLCSSLNALTGGFGQVGYCAANTFLDAFAHFRTATGASYTLSMNSDRWRQIGMAVEAEARLRSLGLDETDRGMDAGEGQEVVHRLLNQSSFPQVIVSTRAFPPPPDDVRKQVAAVLDRPVGPIALAGRRHPRPATVGAYVAPASGMEQRLTAIWEDVFGIEGIGTADDFFQLGGDSLLALQIVNRIRDTCRTEVTVRQFFATPTVARLASLLESNGGTADVEDPIMPRPRARLRGAAPPESDGVTMSAESASR